jgi:hypothetical protein
MGSDIGEFPRVKKAECGLKEWVKGKHLAYTSIVNMYGCFFSIQNCALVSKRSKVLLRKQIKTIDLRETKNTDNIIECL